MSIATMFGFSVSTAECELPEVFPMPVTQRDFICADVVNIFMKIIIDVIERTQGLTDDQQSLLWDNCLASETCEGLVTRLAKAMSEKLELFIVYDKAVNVIRKATSEEERQIKADYAAKGESTVGVYISFKNYMRTDMIKLYSGMEFSTISALSKQMNLSKATQFKMNDLRSSVSLGDSATAKKQAKDIADALKQGKDVLLDAKDTIENAKPDLTATEKSLAFLEKKRAFYLGLPASYITGELNAGLGDSGNADAKAIERGLKNYYFSIVKPVLEAVFGIKTTFKSQDYLLLGTALEALKAFSITDEDILTIDSKRAIVSKLLDISEADIPKGAITPDPATVVVPPAGKAGQVPK